MEVVKIHGGDAACNCYLLYNGSDAVIVDPGGNEDRIRASLDLHKARVAAVLLTHGHFDHIMAVNAFDSAPVYVGTGDYDMLYDPSLNLSAVFGTEYRVNAQANMVEQGQELTFGGMRFLVLHTPGHTPGSVCYYTDGYLFSGDTMMRAGRGRTDLPGGDETKILISLRQISALPEEIRVHPGHGSETTVGRERPLYTR